MSQLSQDEHFCTKMYKKVCNIQLLATTAKIIDYNNEIDSYMWAFLTV